MGWNKNIKGSGIGSLILGISVLILVFSLFLSIADYAVYSMNFSRISKALDNSVSAAVQQIDEEKSTLGLASGFDADTGVINLEKIYIDKAKADGILYYTLLQNIGLKKAEICKYASTASVSVNNGIMEIYINSFDTNGNVLYATGASFEEEAAVEDFLNGFINTYLKKTETDSRIFINGNKKTLEIGKKPYYMAIIWEYPIKGIFTDKNISLLSFKSAKIDRK